jgi:hypothetical protein
MTGKSKMHDAADASVSDMSNTHRQRKPLAETSKRRSMGEIINAKIEV